MKVETAELQYILDDYNNRHFSIRGEDSAHKLDLEGVYKCLIDGGDLTPDPLQEALYAVDFYSDAGAHKSMLHPDTAKKIIRKLHEDMS